MRFFGIFDFQEFLVILFKNHHFPKKFFSGVFIIACDSSALEKTRKNSKNTRKRSDHSGLSLGAEASDLQASLFLFRNRSDRA